MIKLKTILGEGYAWEREAGKPLPTLEQTTAAYAAKMQEEEAKPDYIDADGDGNEEESMKKAFADKEDSAGWKREAENLMNIEHGSYDNSTLNDVIIDMTDAINYGIEDEDDLRAFIKKYDNTNESTFTTKAGLQEMREIPLDQRILRNLKGNDYILSETFKK